MSKSQGYLLLGGGRALRLTKSTEDQDTCLFHELLEEQFASGRQTSSGQGEQGFAQAGQSQLDPCPFPTLRGTSFSGQLHPLQDVPQHHSLTPAPGTIRDQLTVVSFILNTLFLHLCTVCSLLSSLLVNTPFRVQPKCPLPSSFDFQSHTPHTPSFGVAFPTQLGALEC